MPAPVQPTANTNQPSSQVQQRQQKQRRQKKVSEYGQQLAEKQKTRNTYGMREKQFRTYFNNAAKVTDQTGDMLLQILERRIDNVVFRSGIAKSRSMGRQMVSHRHFMLNKFRVNIPSIQVKVGDVIKLYKSAPVELNPDNLEVDWLKVDKKTGTITVLRLPEKNDLPIEFDTQKIIEFYSR
jgi:small subunit ribosomal protein S4